MQINESQIQNWLAKNGYDENTEKTWISQITQMLMQYTPWIKQIGIRNTLNAMTSGDRSVHDTNPKKAIQEYDLELHRVVLQALEANIDARDRIFHLGGIKAIVEEAIRQGFTDTMSRERLAKAMVFEIVQMLGTLELIEIWRMRAFYLPQLVDKVFRNLES